MKEEDQKIGNLLSGNMPNSSDMMDSKRASTILQDFLLKLDQAREWICNIIQEDFDITQFKEELPKAEMLAKVVKALDETFVDRIYVAPAREYKHVDNIMLFLNWLKKMRLRKHFLFETIDLYESKNIPKVIYCIHGLASFLNKRGYGKGIIVRNNLTFTNSEASLFTEDIKNISMQKFEDISNKLESEETQSSKELLSELSSSETEDVDFEAQVCIKNFCKTFVWRNAFLDIVYGGNATISSIRKFINFCFEPATNFDKTLENSIISTLKSNSKKEKEKERILKTIRLLLQNQSSLRNVIMETYPLANDFCDFKRALYLLIQDVDLFRNILNSDFELPISVIFPDNLVGDFHFSNLLFSNSTVEFDSIKFARAHFFTSKAFSNIVHAFTTSQDFDLSPIAMANHLKNNNSKGKLLEEAIKDEVVQNELVEKAQCVVDYMMSKCKFLQSVELPFYVRKFVDHPNFYEYFIEPAIISANNFIIAELFSYIFTENSNAFSQERLIYKDKQFEKSNSMDFSDYSIIKGFLDNCADFFPKSFSKKHTTDQCPSDFFLNHMSSIEIVNKIDNMVIDITIQEINNIIIVLKKSLESNIQMKREIRKLVSEMDLVCNSQSENYTVNVYASKNEIPVEFIHATDHATHKHSIKKEEPERLKEISIPSIKTSYNKRYYEERFPMELGNQYQDLSEEEETAMNTLIQDLKTKILLLITISNKDDLECILRDTDKYEMDYINENNLNLDDVNMVKQNVINDLRFLANSDFMITIIKTDKDADSNRFSECIKKLLNLIANDIIIKKYRVANKEIVLNSETSDALFKKGIWLDRYLVSLYSYLNSLIEGMFVNKGGIIFNRQTGPPTNYGSYKFPINAVKGQIYENLDSSTFKFMISCDTPMLFDLTVFCGSTNISEKKTIRFDDLLSLKESNVSCFDFNEICCFSVIPMIELINEYFINY